MKSQVVKQGGECMKIDVRLYRYIEYELYHYEQYKKDIQREREQILESSPPLDGIKGSGWGSPTEGKAMALSTSAGLRAMEKTVEAIEEVLSRLTERHRRIFEMVYVKGRTDRYGISNELFISYETFNHNKRELIYAVGRRLGVIKTASE